MKQYKISLLMVCTANICRSPMAQGLMGRELAANGLDGVVRVDSAGTHVFNPGHRPDRRAQQVAEKSEVDIGKLKARMIAEDDFYRFDYIVAMDNANLRNLQKMCPEEYRNKLFLILDFAPQIGFNEVPDPYFGNLSGFERVLALLDLGCKGLIRHIRTQHEFHT
ncbi:low molecular weight protein-tyrosine-phosphatase [Sedimenticola hydrogenitrophicus]|uniref:low molecular weight protein-tyrosine-phosphatase n=1 Tax=Sedimenticola hydrogenitrophicus TaxID=2967975 RepID=UPI0021A8635A|nr:low molecular weight protein-tyrosine-phosphatase [Sedimenticola hydrogenitrophicus]